MQQGDSGASQALLSECFQKAYEAVARTKPGGQRVGQGELAVAGRSPSPPPGVLGSSESRTLVTCLEEDTAAMHGAQCATYPVPPPSGALPSLPVCQAAAWSTTRWLAATHQHRMIGQIPVPELFPSPGSVGSGTSLHLGTFHDSITVKSTNCIQPKVRSCG